MFVIEEIDAATGGSSKLRISSLLILGATVVILLMFALFGTGNNSIALTGSVAGSGIVESLDQDDIILEEPSVSTLSEEGKYKLVLNILRLKNLDKKVTKLQFAESVSNIADFVDALNNQKVTNEWTSMLTCLEEGCNELYYNLLEVVLANAFKEAKEEQSFIQALFADEPKYAFMPELLQNVVNLEKAVDTGDIVETSRAMVAVNSFISKVDSTEINDLWNELVNCDLECPYYDELLVKLSEFKLDSLEV